MDDRFAPHAATVVLVRSDAELVGRVGFQVVDDRVAGRAGLVIPLPVPLPVADGVKPADRGQRLEVETDELNNMYFPGSLKQNYQANSHI